MQLKRRNNEWRTHATVMEKQCMVHTGNSDEALLCTSLLLGSSLMGSATPYRSKHMVAPAYGQRTSTNLIVYQPDRQCHVT